MANHVPTSQNWASTANKYRWWKNKARKLEERIIDQQAVIRALQTELEVAEGCERCAELGHHPHCGEYIPTIGELLGYDA